MNMHDSELLLVRWCSEARSTLRQLALRAYFQENSGALWADALAYHGLV